MTLPSDSASHSEPPALPRDEPVGKVNILIVDDRRDSLMALQSALGDLNQNLVTASSGQEALKQVLRLDFAVVLLDVHMPGMDGFETARLIRQRRSCRHTPIIFITGYADELHVAKGYSLGAVDYILAPVVPQVLRAKVNVFVELYEKTAQIQSQADRLRRRASQLQKLSAASIGINTAKSAESMLETITDTARDVVGAHQSITLFLGNPESASQRPVTVCSFSDKYDQWQGRRLDLAGVRRTLVARGRTAVRMTEAELHAHPDWQIVSKLDMPPIRGGMLAAPLMRGSGRSLGVIYLTDPYEGAFTEEDEAILVQLAQKASIAMENLLYAEAREANRLKDEFLATLSHELRTPLNAMLGWIRLLRGEAVDEATREHGLEVIERNVDAQTRLIEDLLDISRITSGKLRVELGETPLREVLETAIDAIKPAADEKSITLHVDLAECDVRLNADADRLQQVAWNLLSNAVKFTPEAGEVWVGVESTAQEVVIRIRDSGEGIDADLLPYIFDRFRQADSTSTRSHAGLGVGLAIVRHIVELHGGTVLAESAGPGHGTTFLVHLPLQPADAGDGPQSGEPTPAVAPPTASMPPGPDALRGVCVLVVDDERDARELLGRVIEHHGGDVEVAGSADEALQVLARRVPGILLSDIAMPEKDGYALIRQVRERAAPPVRDIPAVALTAHAGQRYHRRSLEAGFQMHLPKPIDLGELIRIIAQLARPCDREPSPARVGSSKE
ncbi:MAG: response regulator [Phycisphaeraceae bacterium]